MGDAVIVVLIVAMAPGAESLGLRPDQAELRARSQRHVRGPPAPADQPGLGSDRTLGECLIFCVSAAVGHLFALSASGECEALTEQRRKLPHGGSPFNRPFPMHAGVADGEEQQFGRRLVIRKAAPGLDDLA